MCRQLQSLSSSQMFLFLFLSLRGFDVAAFHLTRAAAAICVIVSVRECLMLQKYIYIYV